MEPEQIWHVAWAKLEALRKHPPTSWDEGAVKEYNDILDDFAVAAPGEDLTPFRVPPEEAEPRVVSFRFATRRSPGSRTMSDKRYVDSDRMMRRLEGLTAYFVNRQPPPPGPTPIGFGR